MNTPLTIILSFLILIFIYCSLLGSGLISSFIIPKSFLGCYNDNNINMCTIQAILIEFPLLFIIYIIFILINKNLQNRIGYFLEVIIFELIFIVIIFSNIIGCAVILNILSQNNSLNFNNINELSSTIILGFFCGTFPISILIGLIMFGLNNSD